ncbi:hypothetical protein FPQ18DRAFT_35204 [Pyronema domesticum]|nr:hypothetical protein FPQ18DRAFT_35204 [Pyronema domesticum]
MGACASCLGSIIGGSKDDSEHAPLLPPLPHQAGYSTYAPLHYPPSPSAAPQLLEREYLDRLVAQTSENLIDIFAPPLLTSSSMSVTPSSRGEWIRGLLDKTIAPEVPVDEVIILDSKEVKGDERRWLSEVLRKGEDAVRETGRVKEVGRLVVGLEME